MRKILLTTVLMLFCSCPLFAQSIMKGVVLDENKNPVIGATVYVNESNKGVITGLDGSFNIEAEINQSISVSYMGYITVDRAVSKLDNNVFQLKPDATELDEVVVVALGTQKRSTITAAVATVSSEAIESRPVTDLTSALQGNVAGLNFASDASEGGTGGEVGSEIKFNIRGIGSINGGEPYVLVDGVEQSMQNVNPADIASVTVLKDASAAAVYGARAAYGVVLVTTKSGREGKAKVTYSGTVGASSPIGMPQLMNSLEYTSYVNQTYISAGRNPLYGEAYMDKVNGFLKAPYSAEFPGVEPGQNGDYWNWEGVYANTDWYDYYYKNFALRYSNNLSITGGSEKINYYVGVGHTYQNGLLDHVTDSYDKFNINSKIEAKVNDWLKFNLNNNMTLAITNRPLPDMLIFHEFASQSNPLTPTKVPMDSPYSETGGQMQKMKSANYIQNRLSDAISLSATITPIENWDIMAEMKGRIDIDNNSFTYGKAKSILPNGKVVENTQPSQGFSYPGMDYSISYPGSYTRGSMFNYYISPNIASSYSNTIEDHYFSAIGGFQSEYQSNSMEYLYRDGMLSDDIFSVANSNGNSYIGEDRSHWSTMGAYARLNWNYNELYFVEVSGRYDGSSRFAPDNRWGFFPSISAGYDIARADYFRDLALDISQFKVRASYGRLGNQNGAGLYDYLGVMPIRTTGDFLFPNKEIFAETPNMVSSFITWEKVDNANLGIDFASFNNRLTATFDIYQRTTRDMIGPAEAIPDSSGIPSGSRAKMNNATLRNRGWELAVNWSDELPSGFTYGVGFNLFDYKAVVTEYNNPTGQIYNNFTGLDRNKGYYEGMNIGEIWGFKADHLFQTNKEIDHYVNSVDLTAFGANEIWQRGDLKYLDTNNDGRVDFGDGTIHNPGDLQIIGDATPRYSFGVNFRLGYKGFELSGLVQGVGKRDYIASGSSYLFGNSRNYFKDHLDYWSPSNTDGYLPRLTETSDPSRTVNTGYNTSRYLLNAAYVRLKNIMVSYRFDSSLMEKIGMSNARVYVTCDNLFTFDALPNAFDPETINQVNWWVGGSNNEAPGLTSPMNTTGNGKVYPYNRNYVLGLELSF